MELRSQRTWCRATSLILKIPPDCCGLATLALSLCVECSEHKAESGFPLAHPDCSAYWDTCTGTWSYHNLLTAPPPGWAGSSPTSAAPGASIGELHQRQEAREGSQRPGNFATQRTPSSSLSGHNPALPASPDCAESGVGPCLELPHQDVCFLGAHWLILCSENYSAQSVGSGVKGTPAPHTLGLYFNL